MANGRFSSSHNRCSNKNLFLLATPSRDDRKDLTHNRSTAEQRKDAENIIKILQALAEKPQSKQELQKKFVKKRLRKENTNSN